MDTSNLKISFSYNLAGDDSVRDLHVTVTDEGVHFNAYRDGEHLGGTMADAATMYADFEVMYEQDLANEQDLIDNTSGGLDIVTCNACGNDMIDDLVGTHVATGSTDCH